MFRAQAGKRPKWSTHYVECTEDGRAYWCDENHYQLGERKQRYVSGIDAFKKSGYWTVMELKKVQMVNK